MRVTSLGSSSSGNALLVEAGPQRRTKLLVDAGLPPRILLERLQQTGIRPAQLQGILITHEHNDHILSLPLLTQRYALPIITDPRTFAAIEQTWQRWRDDPMWIGNVVAVGADTTATLQPLPLDSRSLIGDIDVLSFPVSHDAVAPCGYLLSTGGCRVCVVIDSGEVTSAMLEVMYQADLLILESNHDRERLLRGPYPHSLKQRILSPTGHLSNDQAAEAVLRTWHADSLRWLWLSHLSRTNNTPKLALSSMCTRLQEAHANLAQVHITVLPPGMGSTWDSTQLWQEPSLWEMNA